MTGICRRWPRAALAVLLLAGCDECPDDLTSIEIVPSAVEIGPSASATTFGLEARLWTNKLEDRRSIVEGQGYDDLQWTADPPVVFTGKNKFRATFEVPAGAAPGTAKVTVSVGGKSSKSTITIAANPVAPEDGLDAKYTAGLSPSTAVVYGVWNVAGDPCKMTLTAFVTKSRLGTLVGQCSPGDGLSGSAVLAVDHQMTLDPEAWTTGSETVPADAKQASLRSLPVALRVMVDPPSLQPTVQSQADDDRKASNSILAETRVGVELQFKDIALVPTSGEVQINGCADQTAVTSPSYKPDMLNVYYVNTLNGLRGLTCNWSNGKPQTVIYIAWDKQPSTSFVHETGHALGLDLPRQGHADVIAKLDRTNVMTPGEYDLDPGGRHRLSVGQVFRMNADPGSWLNWATDAGGNLVREASAPRLACQCGTDDPGDSARESSRMWPPPASSLVGSWERGTAPMRSRWWERRHWARARPGSWGAVAGEVRPRALPTFRRRQPSTRRPPTFGSTISSARGRAVTRGPPSSSRTMV